MAEQESIGRMGMCDIGHDDKWCWVHPMEVVGVHDRGPIDDGSVVLLRGWRIEVATPVLEVMERLEKQRKANLRNRVIPMMGCGA